MSSLRVRAQNKLLSKLGAAKPSRNVQFDLVYPNFEQTSIEVLSLVAAMRGFLHSLQGSHSSALVLVQSINNVTMHQDNSPAIKQFVGEIKGAFIRMDAQTQEANVKRFQQQVLKPMEAWMSKIHELKQQVTVFEDEKTLFDHYTRKVMTMREARDKRASVGKPEKAKDVEKLVRNEQKLAASTTSYTKQSEKTINSLRNFVDMRDQTLMPILHRLLQFRVEYANQLHADSARIEAILNNEAFTSNDFNANEQENDPPVQSLSFESFVGENPPVVETTTAPSTTPSFDFSADEWEAKPPSRTNSRRLSLENMNHHQPPPPPPLPASPTSPDSFHFAEYATTPVATMSPHHFFQPPPPPPPSSPSTPWDDAMKPTPIAVAIPYSTMPATLASPTSPSSAQWSTFDNMGHPMTPNSYQPTAPAGEIVMNPFQTGFQHLHNTAMSDGGAQL